MGYFGGRAGIITFEMLRFVTLRYGTLLYVTSHCITIVFYAFFFVFTVENKKQCEQDRIRDERQHSEKPSRVVDRSFLILPRTLRKKKEIICTDSDSKKKPKGIVNYREKKNNNKNNIELHFILTGYAIAFKDCILAVMVLLKWLNYHGTKY